MIRVLRAMAWVRWRVLVHSMQGKVRGDGLERLGRIAGVLSPIIYGFLFIPLALGLSAGALIGGLHMAESGASIDIMIVSVRVTLGLVLVGVLLAPLVRSTQGLQMGVERLMLLPISRRVLHLTESVGALTDPWVVVTIPGLALLPLGLALGGAPVAALLVLPAGLLLLATLGALSSVCANGLLLVFRDRRRAEGVTLILIVLIVLLAFLPHYFEENGLLPGGDDESGPAGATIVGGQPDFDRYFGWAAGLPSELYSRTVEAAANGRSGIALARMAAMGLLAVLLFALSDSFHRRLLKNPERTSGRRSGEPARVRRWTLPGTTPAVSAVALALVRTTLRTVRGKIAVYFVVVMLILMVMIFGRQALAGLPEHWVVEAGPIVLFLGVLLTLVSQHPVLMNQFAVDGAGLTLQFLSPVSDRDLVRGKILGCAILAGISLLLCGAGALVVSPDGSPWAWLAMVLVCISTFVVLAPLCSLTSAFLPKRSNLNRLGKAGDPHGFATILGLAFMAVAIGPPLLLYGIGVVLLERPVWAVSMVTAWLVVALGLALLSSRLAEHALARRRENLFLVAGEGGT